MDLNEMAAALYPNMPQTNNEAWERKDASTTSDLERRLMAERQGTASPTEAKPEGPGGDPGAAPGQVDGPDMNVVPATWDKYTIPAVEGMTVDDPALKTFKQHAHKNGLTGQQFSAMLSYAAEQAKGFHAKGAQERTASERTLRQEWGPQYDAEVRTAQSAIEAIGTPELVKYLNSGAGNHPEMVRAFNYVGKLLQKNQATGQAERPTFGGEPVLKFNMQAERHFQATTPWGRNRKSKRPKSLSRGP